MAVHPWLVPGAAQLARLVTRTVAVVVMVAVFSACGGGDSDPSTESATTVAAASSATVPITTTTSTTSTTTTSTTTTTTPTTTSTTATSTPTTATMESAGPVAACEGYVDEMAGLLTDAAEQLGDGAAISGALADGTLSEAAAVSQLEAVADEFGLLVERFVELGDAPTVAAPLSNLVGGSLVLFESAYDHQAQGAATGDAALIDEGITELADGEALLIEVSDVVPDCATAGEAAPVPTEFATPSETDLTVFFRLAGSLMGTGSYAETPPESLVAGAQASCDVLLAGGDVRSAIEAAVAASPAAGQPFGADEQNLVLLMVTRGANLWCPSVVGDEKAFTSEVTSTIVDIFFEG